MPRFIFTASLLICTVSAVAATAPASDPFAITLAQQSVAALTGGAPVADVTLNANVTSILGSDYESGTATFKAKGKSESRVDLSLDTSGARSDVRNVSGGIPTGAWEKNGGNSTSYAGHNCWTDAAWFFPALSSLTQTANARFIFKYVGQEQHRGVNSQHIQVFQLSSQSSTQTLSHMDFWLDAVSNLPLAIGFALHPDDDMGTSIPVEINFANYQAVSGIQVPFHFQQMLDGGVVLDATVTSATLNTGITDSLFALQ